MTVIAVSVLKAADNMPAKRRGRRRTIVPQRAPSPDLPQTEGSAEPDEEVASTGGSRASTPLPTEILESQPLDSMESQPTTITMSMTTQKRKKTPPLQMNEQQEQEIADWYRSHEMLYNRRLKEYKHVAVKTRLFEEKASQMDPPCTAKQLKVWTDSMRTTLGKLTRKKSGQEAKDYTDREKWILENFGYLTDHIRRIGPEKRKQGGQVSRPTISSFTIVFEEFKLKKNNISTFINLRYLRLKLLKNTENNKKICHIFHHKFKIYLVMQ